MLPDVLVAILPIQNVGDSVFALVLSQELSLFVLDLVILTSLFCWCILPIWLNDWFQRALSTNLEVPYFGKSKQVTKVTFLAKEQNVSGISTDVSEISRCELSLG